MQPKTALEVLFVTFTVREPGAGGLGSAYTAALYTSVHLWLVKTKHLFFWFKASTRSSVPTVQTAPGQPPASTPSASAESRKIVSSSSSVATANGGEKRRGAGNAAARGDGGGSCLLRNVT